MMTNFETMVITRNFQIYAGTAGCGKNTDAERNTETSILCQSDMTLMDLLVTFRFNELTGEPEFIPSALTRAMSEGTSIMFEDFDLLSDEVQFALINGFENGSLECDGEVIRIAPGFRAIATVTRN